MSIPPFVRWLCALIVFMVLGIYIAGTSMKKSVGSAVVDTVMEGFSDETAQTRFMSYAMTIAPLKRIELAKLNQTEVFERTSQLKVFWDKLRLPEVVVRGTVPVEYRYYVDLNDEWKVNMRGEVLNIVAPPLVPGTPSPDISKLNFEVRKGSLFRNEVKVARALQDEMTGLLEKHAKESTGLVREIARTQIASIATQWLTSESKHAKIAVRFSDEAPVESSAAFPASPTTLHAPFPPSSATAP